MPDRPSVVVIGAGLGGLSVAISLAAKGYQVTVVEQNPQVGGKLNVLERDGFTFDLGPSIFTLPQYFEALFARAGRRMADYVRIVPVTPHWRNFFEDGTVFDLLKDRAAQHAEFAKLPGDARTYAGELDRFLDYSRRQYDIVERGYFRKGLENTWDFLRFYRLFELAFRVDHRRSMADAVDAAFSEPHLRDVFQFFIKYVGSSALAAPGYMNLMPHIQFEYDLWYVDGGMYNLARGLRRLADEMGIQFRLGTKIDQLTTNGRRVDRVVTQAGDTLTADYVVSNAEVIPTYRKLLREDDRFMATLERFAPSCSGLVLHLGVDRTYPQLAHHNFFYSRDQRKHFDTVFRQQRIPDDPTIYLVAPTRTDPSKAPPGCDNIKILPHIPHLGSGATPEEYDALKDRLLAKLERMGLTDLRKHVVVEDMWTPVDIERMYGSTLGSIYGVVTDWKRNKGFKAPRRSEKYDNLYFVGGTVNPGGGMPMVVLSGQLAADRLDEDHRRA
jgi:diapolycopene oxygenase